LPDPLLSSVISTMYLAMIPPLSRRRAAILDARASPTPGQASAPGRGAAADDSVSVRASGSSGFGARRRLRGDALAVGIAERFTLPTTDASASTRSSEEEDAVGLRRLAVPVRARQVAPPPAEGTPAARSEPASEESLAPDKRVLRLRRRRPKFALFVR
jgi:hypothetical protein